ncbi:hypothetical protein GGR53DRAFT_464094 [Hypoxylon sp. FL1150]|nr:hypothetical protein GGR53DRAFT_464094 [Hypoxylon sp. FL1150]
MKFLLALVMGMAAAAPIIEDTAKIALTEFLGHEPDAEPKGISEGLGKGVQTGHSSVINIDKDKRTGKRLHQTPEATPVA